MAKIINVEKSQYLTQNIETFTQNKVGQYSKFLDKNPIFITYLAINSVQSRSDVGTGGVESDVGPKSPIRYNQINGLPAFNIPDLRPGINFDENGYDLELDLTDITLLPNTIKPKSGDYIIIAIPNSIEIAFRVHAFEHNTIQSNDFYMFSADLKFTGSPGEKLIERFKPQIVETYETIFENIGTEDKCFIRTVDVAKIRNIGLLFTELKDLYITNYFDKETGTFVCKENDENPNPDETAWYYDKYVERFIMDSEIYYIENDENSIILAPADITELSEKWYPQTIYHAVLKHDTAYMGRFQYCYQVGIQKPLSVFKINDIECNTVNLHITNYPLLNGHSDGLDSTYLYEYFPHGFIGKILDEDEFEDTIESKYEKYPCWKNSSREEDTNDDDNESDSGNFDQEESDGVGSSTGNPEESNENNDNETGNEGNPSDVEDEQPYQTNYLEDIIYNYLTNHELNIDRKKIIKFALQVNNYNYRVFPLVMYIILEYYNSYFKKEDTSELL